MVFSIFLFFCFYLIDRLTPILEPVKDYLFIVNSSMLALKARVVKIYECSTKPEKFVALEPEWGYVLSDWGEELVVKGDGDLGDIVVDASGNFVGFVELLLGDSFLVKTVESKDVKLNVELISDDGESLEGFLIGGSPPLVEVPEGNDVTGWRVFVSRTQDMGAFLRDNGLGYIGKIAGRSGRYYAVDVVEHGERLSVVRR